jgi:hypothetical protein
MGSLMIELGPKGKRESDEPESEREEMEGMELSEEQDAAAGELIRAVKSGDRKAAYMAVCEIFSLHTEEEEKEDGEYRLGGTSMPSPITRSYIVKAARQKAGMDVSPSDTFVTDEEAAYLVDRSMCALYDLLILNQGEEYYAKEVPIAVVPFTTPGTNIYDLPADFYRTTGLYIQAPALYGFFPVEPFMEKDVAFLRTQGIIGFWNPTQVKFRLTGVQGRAFNTTLPVIADFPVARIELLPEPRTPFTLFLRYIPTCERAPYVASPFEDQIYDGIDGWEEWSILDVAIQMVIKEERDPSALMNERARVEARISALAGSRDAVDPERVVDVRGPIRMAALRRNGGARTRWWYP